MDEMLRVIREVEPPTPSSRISTSEALPSPGRQPPGRAGAAEPAGPGRPRLDRDEGAGQGARAAVRLGHRPGRRRRAVPQPRAGLGRPADGGLPAEEVRPAEPRAGGGGGAGAAGAGARRGRDDPGAVRGPAAASGSPSRVEARRKPAGRGRAPCRGTPQPRSGWPRSRR